MSLEAEMPRTDYELKMDILIDSVKTQVGNFNSVAIRAGVNNGFIYSIQRLQNELMKEMEAAKNSIEKT